MSIELIKDVLRIEELRGKEETQALIEKELYLSPSKPDIEKILWTDGIAEVLTLKVAKDILIVTGVVKFKVIYKSAGEEDNIHTMEGNTDFKEEIEILGITEEMSAFAKTNIEYIEETILDERKLSLRALISIEVKVEEVNTLEIIKDIKDAETLETLKEKIKYKEVHGRETSYAIVKELFEIEEGKPAIEEILKLTVKAYEDETAVVEDRIIISGNLLLKIIYYGEGRIATLEKQVGFNHFLEIPGAVSESNAELTLEVVEGVYEILENQDGELKIIDFESKLRISGAAYTENEKDLIVDAYSTKEKIIINMEEINLIENIETLEYKEEIIKEIAIEGIKEVYNIDGHTTIIDSRLVDNELIVEGILGLQMIYSEDITDEINTFKDEIPYKFYISMQEKQIDPKIDLDTVLESLNTTINNGRLIINASIKHKININRNRVLNVLSEIDETGELIDKKNRPSITIYIVQRNDTLWDIAKRYNTTLEEIQNANENINPTNVIPGEKIIIEKKVDISF